MVTTVHVLVSRWAFEDLDLPGGHHELDLTDRQIVAVAQAASAGVLEILGAPAKAAKAIAAAVEPHERSVKAQEEAQADGRWQEGQAAQHALEQALKAGEDA